MSLVLGSLGQTAGRLASGVDRLLRQRMVGVQTGRRLQPSGRRWPNGCGPFWLWATGSDLEWWDTASGGYLRRVQCWHHLVRVGIHDTATEDIATPKEEGARRLLCRGQESPLPGPGIGGGLLIQQCSSEYDPLLQLGRARRATTFC